MHKRVFDFQDSNRLQALPDGQGALDVIVGTDGLSYCAKDGNGAILALSKWIFTEAGRSFDTAEMDLRQILGSDAVFARTFSRVRCALYNANVTLAPRRLFLAKDLPAYFQLLLEPGEYVYGHEDLPEFECSLLFAAEPVAQRLSMHYFPQADHVHLAAPLLRAWLRAAYPESTEVLINVRHEVAQVAVFDRRNLLFYNSFTFRHANDLLYFVLLVYDQFRLRPSEIQLTLSGDLLEDSDIYRLLFRYIQRVRFVPLPDHFVLPEASRALPAHCYFDLYSLSD